MTSKSAIANVTNTGFVALISVLLVVLPSGARGDLLGEGDAGSNLPYVQSNDDVQANDVAAVAGSSGSVLIEVDGYHCGGCAVCDESSDYSCSPYGGYGGLCWPASVGFSDPVPSGKTVTRIEATVNGVACPNSGGTREVTVRVNGTSLGSGIQQGTCQCNTCYPLTISSAAYPGGIPGYLYGGTNELVLQVDGSICVSDVHLELFYEDPSGTEVYTCSSGPLSPICYNNPQQYTCPSPPLAVGDVTLSFAARADLNSSNEYIRVYINGTHVYDAFDAGARQCPGSDDTDQYVMSAADYNSLVAGGDCLVELIPSSQVHCICSVLTVTVTVEYETEATQSRCVVVFEDTFPSTTFDPAKWATVSSAIISNLGINEPSAPYSLRLNGHPTGGDRVESEVINLSSAAATGATLTYHYQRRGGGESPDPNEDLVVSYWDGSGWVELERQLGSGPDMTSYVQSDIPLPPNALHASFRLQIRSIGTSSSSSRYDDWFVDDVSICIKVEGTCLPPAEPTNPSPIDGAVDVPIDTDLSWDDGEGLPPITITFDEASLGTPADGLVIADATFGFSSSDATVDGGPGTTLYIDTPNIEGDIAGTLTLDFAIPVFGVAYGFALESYSPQVNASTMIFFDSSMNSIGSYSAEAQDMGFHWAEGWNSGTSTTAIAHVVITFTHPSARRFALDNLTYSRSIGGLPPAPTITETGHVEQNANLEQEGDEVALVDGLKRWPIPAATEHTVAAGAQDYPPAYFDQSPRLPAAALDAAEPATTTAGATVIFQDDMESGPSGWTHYLISSSGPVSDDWTLSTARSASGTTSWHSGQSAVDWGDTALESPDIDLAGASAAMLTFNHWYHFDECDDPNFDPDGGIVEVRVLPGSAWTQIYPTGGYPSTLDQTCGNPLEMLDAYTRDGGGAFLPAEFDLTPFAGSVIRIRFHVGWDCGNCIQEEGWYIDDVVVSGDGGGPPSDCLVINGDFETGDFSGWMIMDSGTGNWVINDGIMDPPGPEGPLPPCNGSFSALTIQPGSGVHTLYQDVVLPAGASSATLKWTDMIHNHGGMFQDPNQEFRVEIRDPSDNSVLETLFSTNPGDPLISPCTSRSADISAYAGQTIRLAFTEQDDLGHFNVHVDDVCIDLDPFGCPTTYDVYFGTVDPPTTLICSDVSVPICDPGILSYNTTYYWQVVAKNAAGSTPGDVWWFETEGNPPVCHIQEVGQLECEGLTTAVQLDGSGSYDPDPGDTLTYLWTTNCAGGSFDDPTSPMPTLTVNSVSPCPPLTCASTLTVTDNHGLSSECSVTITIEDTTSPVISITGDESMTLECHIDTYTELGATASDDCDQTPIEVIIGGDVVDPDTPGTYHVTYDATDACGNTAEQAIRTVTVEDTTPPAISITGDESMTLECHIDTYTELGATASDDCDQTPIEVIIGGDVVDPDTPGTYHVTYDATDAYGNTAEQAIRTVTVADTTPPVVTVGDMIEIWPPNHKYHTFNLSDFVVSVEDACEGSLDVEAIGTILSIYSDEPEDAKGGGDGNTVDDIVILGPSSFQVLAERQGKGNGRVYGITFEVVDTAGNSVQTTCYVGVPHDHSGDPPVDDGAGAGYTVP